MDAGLIALIVTKGGFLALLYVMMRQATDAVEKNKAPKAIEVRDEKRPQRPEL